MDRTDVVVIGAGIMGSSAARALGERGVDAALVEQFPIGHTRGSSHGPVRIFRLSYPHPDYTRMAVRARALWRSLEERAGEPLVVSTGGIDVGTGAELCGASLSECGVPFEWLTSDEAMARFPAARFEGWDRVLYQADAGVALADNAVFAQVRLAKEAGVDVREGVGETHVRVRHEGVVVRTGEGDVEARVAILTPGSWARELLAQAGLGSLPLSPVLKDVSYYAPPGGAPSPPLPTWIDWGPGNEMGSYMLPPAAGSPGIKIGQHQGGRAVDPRDGPFEVDPILVQAQAAYVAAHVPVLDPVPVRSEVCLYTVTPDEDFVIDRRGPVVVGAGFSGHGFKFGPLIGELLADLAIGVEPDMPVERFSLDRPALRVEGPPPA
jgi:sarcosine oxidase